MKKKIITILFVALLLLLLSGCTLRFEGEKIKLETEPPEAKIGQNQNNNTTLQLVQLDIFKNTKQ